MHCSQVHKLYWYIGMVKGCQQHQIYSIFDVFVTHWDCTMYYTKHCGYINYCPFTALHHPQQHSAAPCPTGENV